VVRARIEKFPSIDVDYQRAYAFEQLSAVQRAAAELGGELVSDYYLGIFEPLEFRCQRGHVFKKKPVDVIHRRTWCPRCWKERQPEIARRQRKSIEDLRRAHEWRCKRGHQFHATPANVLMGKWCAQCARDANSARVREQYAGLLAESVRRRGGVIVEGEYRSAKSRITVRCQHGHEWTTAADSIRNGRWCPHCAGIARRTIEDAREFARKLGGECVSDEYRNANSPLTWRCGNGHVFRSSFWKARQGNWCRQCRVQTKST
jgi:hypothetical protein